MTACSQEKKPNEMPATLPNAKCGNRAVPPDTGYIAAEFGVDQGEDDDATPAMTQPSSAAVAAACAANSAPNSQPGADDGGLGRPGGPDQPHLPPEADIRRLA